MGFNTYIYEKATEMAYITTIEDITRHVPVHKHTRFSTFAPFLYDVETTIRDLISYDQFDALEPALLAPATPQEGEAAQVVQKAMAWLIVREGLPFLRNHVSEMGVQQTHMDDSGQSRAAPVEDVRDLKLTICRTAYNTQERLLTLLESYPNIFTHFFASDQFTQSFGTFTRTLTDLKQHTSIITDRKSFQKMKPFLTNANNQVRQILCNPLYNDLNLYNKLLISDQSVAAFPVEYTELLQLAGRLEAYLALRKFAAVQPILFIDGRIVLQEFLAGSDKYRSTGTKDINDAIERIRNEALNDGKLAETDLRDFLTANVEQLPLYFNSPCYTKREELKQAKAEEFYEGASFWM